ncbi:MAG TPA: hypothetical protein VM143_00540 [Acidimicrobiales bacterium]|nr:hypothetical protein [Acidimicrobiales bacterium]
MSVSLRGAHGGSLVVTESPPPSNGRGEQGAYLVLYALLAVGFFTMAAIVVDIAALRQGRRADRTAADLAVTAGVTELDSGDPSSFAGACDAAWGYVLANRTEAAGPSSAPDCVGAFPAVACNPTSPVTATGTVGPITVEITYPVPDASPLMLAETQGGDSVQPVDAPTDGTACERLAVRIVRSRMFLFGQVAGIVAGSTDVHSVARALTATSTTEVPAVVALERTGCNGVFAAADGTLTVQGVGQGGVVVVDSDASGCAGGFALDVFDGGGARVDVRPSGPAPGLIRSFALAGSNFARAFDVADTGAGRLTPTPTPSLTRTGRALLDNRYNCTSTCAAGADFVDQLEAADGAGVPAGHALYPDPTCIVLPATTVTIVGDTFVDCAVLDVQGDLTFDAASVVFAGEVIVRASGCLAMNDTSCGAAGVPARDGVAFVRGGLTKEPDARLHLVQAFVWLGGALVLPLDPNPAGTSSLQWTAPLAGRFEDLLLWGESPLPMQLGGQESLALQGTLFTPNTTALTLEARNASSWSQPAQVVTSRLLVAGSGDVTLRPVAGRSTGSLTRQVRLIR